MDRVTSGLVVAFVGALVTIGVFFWVLLRSPQQSISTEMDTLNAIGRIAQNAEQQYKASFPEGRFDIANTTVEPLAGVKYNTATATYDIQYVQSDGAANNELVDQNAVQFEKTTGQRYVVFRNRDQSAVVYLHGNDRITQYSVQPPSNATEGTSTTWMPVPILIPVS